MSWVGGLPTIATKRSLQTGRHIFSTERSAYCLVATLTRRLPIAGFWISLTAGVLTGLGTYAQALQPLPLSVEQAVEMGLGQGPDVRIAASQSREVETQIGAARSLLLPTVNGTADYTRDLRPIKLPPGFDLGGFPIGGENTYNFGLLVAQPIYSPGAMRGVEIARDYFRAAQDQETELRLSYVLGICQAYYGAALANRLADIAQAQIDQLDEQLKETKLQREAGNASELDISRIEVLRESVTPQLAQTYNARDETLFVLKQLINLEAGTPIELTDELAAESFRPLSDDELNLLSSPALEQRAAFRAAQRMNRIRQAEIRQAKSAYLPSLNFQGHVGEQGLAQNVIPSRQEFREQWTIGVALTIPLFEGGRRAAGVKGAKERLTQSELQLEKLLLSIRSDLENWRIKLKRAEELIATRSRASAQAARVYDLTDFAFDQGSASHLELTDARTNLRQARANEVQAVHDYYVAYLNLVRAAGAPPESFAHAQTLSSHKFEAAPTRTKAK